MPVVARICTRFGAQILSLGAAFGGLAGGFEGAGAAAQEEGKRPGPWLWQEWPRGAAAAEGGRRDNRLEATNHEILWRYCGDIVEILWRYCGDIVEI